MGLPHNQSLSELTETVPFAKPQLLRIYTLIAVVGASLALGLGWFANHRTFVVSVGGILIALSLAGLLITHVGRIQIARKLLVAGVFSVLTLVVTQGTGALGIESAAFVTGIAMTGLLYRAPLLWLSVLYGIGVIGVLAYWRWPYWVADSTQSANLTAALGFVLLYAVTGALIGMLKSRLDKTWLELSQNRAHLARNVQALAIQVAERERAEQIAREQSIELGALFDLSTTLSSTLELSQLLGSISAYLRQSIGFETIAIVEPANNGMRTLHHSGALTFTNTPTPGAWMLDPTLDSDLRRAQGTCMPVIIEDVPAGRDAAAVEKRARAQGQDIALAHVASHVIAPLLTRNRVTGYLVLAASTPGAYTASDSRLIAAFASIIAASIEKSRLVDQSMLNATLAERSRIARELHDSVSQMLFGITLGMRTALHLSDSTQPQTREALNYVYHLAESALTDTRAIVFELRPEYLEKEGLVSALKKQAETLCLRHNLAITTKLPEREPEIDLKKKEAIYRIALEAIQNAIKHSGAKRITLTMRCDAAVFELTVADDGRGFDTSAVFDSHFGLKTMRERADQLNAELTIESVARTATTVKLTVPITAPTFVAFAQPGLMR